MKLKIEHLVSKLILVTAALVLAATATAQDKIKIGVLFALGGTMAFLGEPQLNTFKMLVDEKNAKGGFSGRKIEYIVYDTEGNGTKAVQQFRRLVESDKVDVVFGPNTSAEALLIKPLASELQIPTMAFSGGEEVVVPVNPWVFQAVPHNRIVVNHFYDYLRKLGHKKVGLLTATDAFGQGGLNTLKQLAPNYGITVVSTEEFGNKDTDMTPQILKIKSVNPDVMIVWGLNPGPSIIMRNAKAVNFDRPIFNSNGVASPQFIAQTGAAGEGSWVSSPRLLSPDTLQSNDPAKPLVKKLFTDYSAKYKKEPAAFAAIPHDALLVLEAAMTKVQGALTRKAIREALEGVSNVVGANGTYTFSAENHSGQDSKSQPMVMMKIVNGKFIAQP